MNDASGFSESRTPEKANYLQWNTKEKGSMLFTKFTLEERTPQIQKPT